MVDVFSPLSTSFFPQLNSKHSQKRIPGNQESQNKEIQFQIL